MSIFILGSNGRDVASTIDTRERTGGSLWDAPFGAPAYNGVLLLPRIGRQDDGATLRVPLDVQERSGSVPDIRLGVTR